MPGRRRLAVYTILALVAAAAVYLVGRAAGVRAVPRGRNLAVDAAALVALAGFDGGRNWRSGRAWVDAVRWWGRLRPLVGLVVFAAVVGPWVIWVHHREPAFLPAMFGN